MLKQLKDDYSPRENIPLESYAAVTLVFGVLMVGAFWDFRKRREEEPLTTTDLIGLGIATHKMSRLLSKDAVTAFLRAPFTRYEESLGYGELKEEARGKGLKLVLGELASCNYCLSVWSGLGLMWSHYRLPRFARPLIQLLNATAISDFLHVIYEERRTKANVLTLQEEAGLKKAS